ncbi:hypothetical protein [Ekhidna sp. To15]|uniref:hypothetical protein n=1 Tax=Ekhidna sp. To15 TaxID=3395267 RepID=UPI003F521C51
MSDLLDSLKNKWQAAKSSTKEQRPDTKELIQLARNKMKGAVNMHIGNIAVLALTLVGISAFFIYVAQFQNTLSHFGILLMLGGLALRIAIEGYSIYLSKQVDLSQAAATANDSSLRFYSYRKRIHGPVTVAILIAYTVGFYMLTPEFSDYFTTNQVILLDLSYLGAAVIFIYSIRKAIKKEMSLLDELNELSEQFE